MRESSCPSVIQGEERGLSLRLWRREEWHAGLLSALISTCDYAHIQGGRHSGALRKPPGLADWGWFVCQPAETQAAFSVSLPPACIPGGTRSSLFSSFPRRAGERSFTGGATGCWAESEPVPTGGHICVPPEQGPLFSE